jgi:hypothetical protein
MTNDNEYHALENSNPEGGLADNSVGQDEGSSNDKSSSGEWKEQAKYFQSEKDKLYQENQKLSKLAQVGEYIRTNPELAKKLADHIDGKEEQPKQTQLSKDEFDPWEAYNDPASKSYKFREQEEAAKINSKVDEAVGNAVTHFQKDIAMDKLVVQLEKRGLDDKQVKSFLEFTSKNPSTYGIDGAIKMWQSVSGLKNASGNPLDKVRETQNIPQSAGVLQGQKSESKDESDEMWKGIMGSTPFGTKSGKLP